MAWCMKVLLIEDEPKMVRSLRKGLEEHLIEVDAAGDGPTGQALAERNRAQAHWHADEVSLRIEPRRIDGGRVVRVLKPS